MGQKNNGKKITYEVIKTISSELFLNNGFANTSMQKIADVLQIKKASLYHHIQSREQLLVDIVTDIEVDCAQALKKVKSLNKHDERNKQFIQLLKQKFADDDKIYLLLKLSLECHHQQVGKVIAKFISDWINCLKNLCQQADSLSSATAAMQQLIGALIMAKTNNKKIIVSKTIKQISQLL